MAGRKVAVFGLGASGTASALALLAGGAEVAAWDDGEAARSAAAAAGVPLADLGTADWRGFSALVLAPGVPLTHPEPHWTVVEARSAGVEVIGDTELFFRERAAHCPDAPVICITGTNGKSTTTALVAHILRHAGCEVEMGGNIGKAILTLAPPSRQRFHVVEMSSYQIDLTPSLAPTVGVLLNITPDHLDRHGTFDHYAAVKERLVAAATLGCVGIDDPRCLEILKRKVAVGAVVAFCVRRSIAPGYSMLGSQIVCSDATGLAVRLADLAGIATLRGAHNAENALAAVASVRECLRLAGRSTQIDWQGALGTFPGLAHRLEQIGHAGRVLLVNDSKATNAESTEKALASFPRAIHWIVGGKAKEGGIESLAPYFPRVAKAYLIGSASDSFAATLDGRVALERCGTLDVALARAIAEAAASDDAEPVVLLSPACASYDQYRNFEVRGDHFRELARQLPGFVAREDAP